MSSANIPSQEAEQYREYLEQLVAERTAELRAANELLQQEIAERKRIEAEHKRLLIAEREQRLLAETLGEVTLALTSQTDHIAVLNEILRQAQRIVSYNTANITLLENDLLRAAFWQGYDNLNIESFVAHLTQALADFPLERAVVQSRAPLVIENTEQQPGWVVQAETAWIKSYLIVPICHQDQVLGLLRLGGNTPGQFSIEDAQSLQTLAHSAAIALQNAHLYAEMQQRLQEQMALREAGAIISSTLDLTTVLSYIAEQMGRMIDVSSAYIGAYQAEAMTITILAEYISQQANILEQVSDLGVVYDLYQDFPSIIPYLQVGLPKIYHLDDSNLSESEKKHLQQYGAQTTLNIPLQVAGQTIAYVSLWESRRRREFTPTEIALVRAMAQQAAIAIEKAQLYEKTQKQARQLEQTLHAIRAGVLLLDAHYRIQLVNTSAEEYLALLAGVKMGQRLTHLGERPLAELLVAAEPGHWHEVTPAQMAYPIFQVYARPVMAGLAQPEGWVVVIRDVTEERDTQMRLQQQEKLAAVGQLAAGIAHDFNNILTSIIGFAELARYTPGVPVTVADDLSHIVYQGRRAAHLVRQILDFARKNIVAKQLLDLTSLLEDIIHLLERTIPENIRLEWQVGPAQREYMLNADATQIQQALTNLAVNAADAMPLGGVLRFTLTAFSLAVGQRPPCPEMRPGNWLALAVADNGVGMSPDVQKHLFEPFFTTKEVGQGTGLGLAQVEGIVKQHDGYIEVESQPGRGTTFTLYFPLAASNQPADGMPFIQEDSRRRQGHDRLILLVGDNLPVLEVVEAMLKRLGYQVLTAANGRSAVEIYDQYQANIALVVTDLTMPEMGGLALAEALQTRNPQVKILAMTGYPLKIEDKNLSTQRVIGWLQKPLNFEQLAEQLEQALIHPH